MNLPSGMTFASDAKSSLLGPLVNYEALSAYEYKNGTYTSYPSGLRKPYIPRK